MKRILSIAVIAIFTTVTAFGQTPQKITLQDAINIALENNYQLKQAENNLGLAETTITSEYADFLPSISGSLSGSRQIGRQFIQESLSFADATSNSISGSVRASLPIFNGFQNILTLKQSQVEKESAEAQLERARETVIFQTASAFLQVLLTQELLEIAKENLATSQKQLDQINAQVEVGSRASVDGYNQESTVAQNELTVTQRENTLQLNKLVLVNRMQVDPLGQYEFIRPEITENDAPNASETAYVLNTLIEEALSNRSDFRSSEANITRLDYQLKMAKAALIPTLSANASVSSGYSDQYSFGGNDVSFSDQFFDQRINRGIGLSLNIPIFSNWNRMNNIETSKVNLKNAELSLENTKRTIIQEVTQAYTDYSSIVKQLDANKKSLLASEKAFETQQERYDVGASTLIELSQAQANYVSAKSGYTQAVFNLVFQEKLLDYYLGKLTGDEIEF